MSRGRQRNFRHAFANSRITRGALYLLFAEVGLSLLYLISEEGVRQTIREWLSANSTHVWHEFKIWTLVTSPILQIEFISLFFDALLLWLLLPTLERLWGTKKFLLFALWTSLAATTIGSLTGLLLGDPTWIAGLDAFIYAGFVAYGVLFADHPVSFFGVLPMTGKQLMFGIIGFVALFILLGQRWVDGAAYAAAMVLAWMLTSGRWSPRLWYLRWRHKRMRRHLTVVRDDDDPGKWIN
ncbi:MAG: rhomboid family intramembrane serine protease [Proteobacteria bacterium]|nr:rhomboid family intramembrane serine protease [Pseudomonadota bacterium]